MKLLFDQNLSYKIVNYLPLEYKGSSHVRQLGLQSATDREIWQYAKSENFTIITQDYDFIDLIALQGFPPKVILLRIKNYKVNHITSIFTLNYNRILAFDNDLELGSITIYD